VLVHYMNEGLTAHPMHLHQLEQLVVAKDGIPLETPYLADTINVAPASATRSSSPPTSSARGPGTATSSPTPSATPGCSAW
jgi:FtsP/CotA-like multicopper oxidase with cupredoxin domain